MLDDSTTDAESAAPAPPPAPSGVHRATPAGIEIVAFCRSLPADGRLSNDDVEVLKDWTDRYRDIFLPSHEYVSSVVTKALADRVITPDEQDWVYFAVEPVLPVQLRKRTLEQRRIAELT